MGYGNYGGYSAMYAAGREYEDFVQGWLLRERGVTVTYYRTQREQYEIGESVEGYEVKYDSRCWDSKRLSIEVAEVAGGEGLVPSGINRDDNTIYYCQGSYRVLFVFRKAALIEWQRERDPETTIKFGTIKTFYLPFDEAERIAEYVLLRQEGQ